MLKTISMLDNHGEEKEVIFEANAGTPIRLKHTFGRDFWKIFGNTDTIDENLVFENLDVISEIAFIMHCQGKHADMNALTFDDYVNWLETLDGMAILNHALEILRLYITQDKRNSKPKKGAAQQPAR